MDAISLQCYLDKRTIKLPCSIGDTFYWVNKYIPTPRIEEFEVVGFTVVNDGIYVLFNLGNQRDKLRLDSEIFFNKEDAQKLLDNLK